MTLSDCTVQDHLRDKPAALTAWPIAADPPAPWDEP
jgi:hypothetical protein